MEVDRNFDWSDKRILVVEDDDNSSKLLELLLKPTNAHVNHVYTGVEAVEFIKENPETDLILMDINLPDKDGLTATNEIREISRDIIIIAQTAYIGVINKAQAQRAGADDFLTKPINLNVFYAMLEDYFEKQKRSK